jgi:hypothetical protein
MPKVVCLPEVRAGVAQQEQPTVERLNHPKIAYREAKLEHAGMRG